MNTDQHLAITLRQQRTYQKLKQTHSNLLDWACDFFHHKPGERANSGIEVIRVADSPCEFKVRYVGREFEGKFSAFIEGETVIGQVALYEAPPGKAGERTLRSSLEFNLNATVIRQDDSKGKIQLDDHEGVIAAMITLTNTAAASPLLR